MSRQDAVVTVVATFDDYVAGRTDRLGPDVVCDLRPPQDRRTYRMRGAVDAGPDVDLRALGRRIAVSRADLVWLWSPALPPRVPAGHLATLVALCRRLQLPALVIEDDIADAIAVGLLDIDRTPSTTDAAP